MQNMTSKEVNIRDWNKNARLIYTIYICIWNHIYIYYIMVIKKICNRYTHTHKRERNPNITVKLVIKSQGKRVKEQKRIIK